MARSSAARCSLISSQSLISCPLPARAPPRAAAAQSACQPHSRPIPPSSLSSKFLLVIALPGAQPLAPYINTSRFISPAPSRPRRGGRRRCINKLRPDVYPIIRTEFMTQYPITFFEKGDQPCPKHFHLNFSWVTLLR